MVCFRYVTVNTLQKGDNKDDMMMMITTTTTKQQEPSTVGHTGVKK
jgi:hypothetical protein